MWVFNRRKTDIKEKREYSRKQNKMHNFINGTIKTGNQKKKENNRHENNKRNIHS